MASSRLERIGTIFTRKHSNENLLTNLSEVLSQSEADYNAMKENEKKLEQLTGALMKCIQQATTAQKQKLKMLKDIHTTYKKEVEGLIKHGAIKPDDRPVWFDVYKAFPPISEPKFSKPLPELTPIRPILYKEDVIRAKFHAKGHGVSGVNMLTPTGESHTKRLIKQYYKLEAEGVSEEELIEKSAAATSADRSGRQEQPARVKETVNPKSATAQILSEVDIKNLFKEEK